MSVTIEVPIPEAPEGLDEVLSEFRQHIAESG
jgi:hypothetical protein